MNYEKITKAIYEATRKEAEWSRRSIVPETWKKRDEKFRNQMVDVVKEYLTMNKLPTPEEAHNSWMKSYLKMGWKYGPARNPEKKTHPDLIPYWELPQDERDKDAIFLSFVFLVKQVLNEDDE